MDENKQKARFSEAFVRAIAAVAGFGVTKPDIDDDSIDLIFEGHPDQGLWTSPRLEAQLKCTARTTDTAKADTIPFPLPQKNYLDLSRDAYLPRILIVVFVPQRVHDWLEQDSTSLLLRHNALWLSLKGKPANKNTTSTTVKIPSTQQFTVKALTAIMNKIDKREWP